MIARCCQLSSLRRPIEGAREKAVTGCIHKVLHGTGTAFIVARKGGVWGRSGFEDDVSGARRSKLERSRKIVCANVQTSPTVYPPGLYAARNAAHSIARRPAGHLDFNRRYWTLDFASLPLGNWRCVRQSGSENLFCHLGIFDYDAVAAGAGAKLNHPTTRGLCEKGLPNFD